ncbi:MAG: hypothetical protein AAGC74_05050 [Verrucomicrobiota bacterium]
MQQPPPGLPPSPDQTQKDASHLKLLSVFHYIYAGFCLLGIVFVVLHFFAMDTIFSQPEIWEPPSATSNSSPPSNPAAIPPTPSPTPTPTSPPPEALESIMAIFRVFYVLVAIICLLLALFNFLTARFLTKRNNRIFCLINAGINCLNIPLGTILGIFTIIVLLRTTVEREFASLAS